jgi:hypothetical protein
MAGLHLPFPLVVREILHILGMAPTQLKPNGWRNVFACCVAWPMVLGEGVHLSAPEFLNLFAPVKYGHTWTLQARKKRFFSTPSTWSSNPVFESSFFFVSGLGWELPNILRGRLPEIRVPRHWREITSKKFPKPKLTAVQQDRVNRMVAWSSQSLKAKGKNRIWDSCFARSFLQKYLGYSEHRCARNG